MGQQDEIQRVIKLLSIWLAKIRLSNAIDFFDINHIAEDVAAKLLNLIYNLELKNLNEEKKNFPGIDLGDDKNRIAYQITSRKDPAKIEESLKIFAEKHIQRFSRGIRFLIVNNDKPSLTSNKYATLCPGFDPDIDVLTDKDLIVEIRKIFRDDKERFNEILAFLEEEFLDDLKSGGRKNKDISLILKDASNRYYNALTGPNGRFKGCRYISEPLLPRLICKGDVIQKTMVSLSDALPILWQKECKHAVIVGDTGTGKTFSMIHLWKKFLENSDEIKPITVFVPLNEFNEQKIVKRDNFILSMIQKHYWGTSTSPAEIWEEMRQPSGYNGSIPWMILLLDGFNEILVETKELLFEVNQIVEQCPMVQVVISSRFYMRDDLKSNEWNLLSLRELEDTQVNQFLALQKRELPLHEEFWVISKNPMKLALYSGIFEHSKLQESIEPIFRAKALREIAEVYRVEGEFKKAYSFAKDALDYDNWEESDIFYKLGIYAALAKMDATIALDYIKKAIGFDANYSNRVESKPNWEEIKTDILNHLGCFAYDETSKEKKTTNEIEVLAGGKDEVTKINDERFLKRLGENILRSFRGMGNPSVYISFDCIGSWFKLKDIRPDLKNLISRYNLQRSNDSSYFELQQSILNFKSYVKIFYHFLLISLAVSYIGTTLLYFKYGEPFFKTIGVKNDMNILTIIAKVSIFILLFASMALIFPIDFCVQLLRTIFGNKNHLTSLHFIMAYITIVILIVCIIIGYISMKKDRKKSNIEQDILRTKTALNKTEEDIEALKSNIIRHLDAIRWE